MITLPAPRLLPVTITMMAVLLVVKGGVLLQGALTNGYASESLVVTVAKAAGADKEQPKPPPTLHSPPLAPPPADPPRSEPVHAASPPRPSTSTAGAEPPPVSESERAILQELRQRRTQIDARESSVVARESVLAAAEQKLAARVGELQALQQKLEGLDAAQKQRTDAGWEAMVRLYEAMKPKEAAAIFNELPMPVLLQLMDRMKAGKGAAVMAAMTPEKARDVTAELAVMRTSRDAASEPPQKPAPLGG